MDNEQKFSEYDLPPRSELEQLFGPLEIDESSDLIGDITDKIKKYLETYSSFLENLLQPDSSLVAMKESSIIDDTTRSEIYVLFKQLTYYERMSLSVELNPEKDNRLAYLKTVISFWKEIKPRLQEYLDTALSVWKDSESDKEPSQAYFG